jgi:hypothetical protein
MMRLALALAIPLATVLACSTSISEPATAVPTVNDQQIINRLTHDIWPAVSKFNGQPTQESAGAQQFHAIIDPNMRATGSYMELREAIKTLGQQGQYDPQTQTTHSNDGLAVAHAAVQSVQGDIATLDVCYTYTHYWYVNVENMQHAPGASDAAVQLANVNNTWYLRGITNDHVVPSCPSDKA